MTGSFCEHFRCTIFPPDDFASSPLLDAFCRWRTAVPVLLLPYVPSHLLFLPPSPVRILRGRCCYVCNVALPALPPPFAFCYAFSACGARAFRGSRSALAIPHTLTLTFGWHLRARATPARTRICVLRRILRRFTGALARPPAAVRSAVLGSALSRTAYIFPVGLAYSCDLRDGDAFSPIAWRTRIFGRAAGVNPSALPLPAGRDSICWMRWFVSVFIANGGRWFCKPRRTHRNVRVGVVPSTRTLLTQRVLTTLADVITTWRAGVVWLVDVAAAGRWRCGRTDMPYRAAIHFIGGCAYATPSTFAFCFALRAYVAGFC